ncbi:carbon-nitrogen hydrolase [Ephemerocybe angulata]|uniref:Carbon-nitrogen hydrolase n=2 Tax=Ephemerocybe angulata TaxID=980116 RepID=A0A8H6HAG6_9AGAR|nr:carbon-nitrogen hydrolase [Tulosesus angulatus]
MPTPRLNLRIGVVQLNPKIGQVQGNIKRARELCSKLQPKSLDLLCFPEMAFSGYVFENATAISPHLEEPRVGPTSQFCAELAKKLNCYVLAGYPEKLSDDEDKPPVLDAIPDPEQQLLDSTSTVTPGLPGSSSTQAVGANSAVLYDPQGEWAGGYRKTNLYDTDKTWAKPGTGFATFHLPSPLQTVSLGICMDLNTMPGTPWTSLEDGPYELADYVIKNKAKVLVLLNSWLKSSQPQDLDDDGKNDWNTLEYWASRLRPLWAKDARGVGEGEGEETIVVVCNRSGTENGITFAGTSSIFSMVRNSGRPKLLDMMERDEEGVRVWNITI